MPKASGSNSNHARVLRNDGDSKLKRSSANDRKPMQFKPYVNGTLPSRALLRKDTKLAMRARSGMNKESPSQVIP